MWMAFSLSALGVVRWRCAGHNVMHVRDGGWKGFCVGNCGRGGSGRWGDGWGLWACFVIVSDAAGLAGVEGPRCVWAGSAVGGAVDVRG